jgi:hypothetical protein
MPKSIPLMLLLASFGASAYGQKTEAGLLAAWEQAQRSDSKTTRFEKLKDREYRFATSRFPFDGQLVVRNLVIDDFPQVETEGISTGTVEVELQGVTQDFYRTFGVSYARWNQSNTLYWNAKLGQWLSPERYFLKVRENLPVARTTWPFFFGFGWTGLLLVLIVVVLVSVWRSFSRMKVISERSERTLKLSERNSQIAERNLQLQEENAKVFREILEQLRKNRP